MDIVDGFNGRRERIRGGDGVRCANVQRDFGKSAGGPQVSELFFIGGGRLSGGPASGAECCNGVTVRWFGSHVLQPRVAQMPILTSRRPAIRLAGDV